MRRRRMSTAESKDASQDPRLRRSRVDLSAKQWSRANSVSPSDENTMSFCNSVR